MTFNTLSPPQEDGFELYFINKKLIVSSAGTVSSQWLEFLPYGLMFKSLCNWETKVEVVSFLLHEFLRCLWRTLATQKSSNRRFSSPAAEQY